MENIECEKVRNVKLCYVGGGSKNRARVLRFCACQKARHEYFKSVSDCACRLLVKKHIKAPLFLSNGVFNAEKF